MHGEYLNRNDLIDQFLGQTVALQNLCKMYKGCYKSFS